MDAEGIKYLVTADRKLQFQQNLDKYAVVVVVLAMYDIRLKNLVSHVSTIEAAILDEQAAATVIFVDLRQ